MASGQTQYYELNQWEGRDQVLRTEFNADNARIDRALHELRARNCQLYMLTYTGTGSGGRSFTFPHRPAAVLIMGGIVTFLCAIQGESYIYLRYGNVDNKSRAVWEGSTVSWELANDDPVLAANAAGERYTLLALLDAPRQVGLCARASHILTPRKSVTAILGVADHPIQASVRSCLGCPAHDSCQYRKSGGHCGIS